MSSKHYKFVVKEHADGTPFILGEPLTKEAEGGCEIEMDRMTLEDAHRTAAFLNDEPIRLIKTLPRVSEFPTQVKV